MSLRFWSDIVFWLSAAALFYTYAGYPLLLMIVSNLRSRGVRRGPFEPPVSVIITAYNEERDLAAKLENTLALDYPRELLEIIVASDCSTDRTDEIVRTFAAKGVKLVRQTDRLGKTAAQNAAVEQARGEIILFSDATSLYQPNVVREILPNFADPTVGCVAGCLIYFDHSDSRVGRGARSYWSYETFLKKHESRACSLIGASGCLYAVRRSAYVPLYHEACSDFIIATKMVEQGLRAVYEPNAICMEETNRRAAKEIKMRVRIIAQTFTDLWRHRAMLNPLRSGFYAVQLLSHKVMRYLVPFFLMAIFTASAILARGSLFYRVMFTVQLAGYASALLAWVLDWFGIRSRVLALPQYFVLANLASLMALYQFLRGERYALWEPIREHIPPNRVTVTGKPTKEWAAIKIARQRRNEMISKMFEVLVRHPDGLSFAVVLDYIKESVPLTEAELARHASQPTLRSLRRSCVDGNCRASQSGLAAKRSRSYVSYGNRPPCVSRNSPIRQKLRLRLPRIRSEAGCR